MPRPRIGAGADDTNAKCVGCHGWSILVRATFGVAREKCSNIVIAGFDVDRGRLREVAMASIGHSPPASRWGLSHAELT